MKSQQININKTIIFIGNTPQLKNTPKSEAGIRRVPIPNILQPYLEMYLGELKTFIAFPDKSGNYMSRAIFRKFWDNALGFIEQDLRNRDTVRSDGCQGKDAREQKKENSEKSEAKPTFKYFNSTGDITPHIFRHTYATILYRSGVDIKAAQKMLGHSTIHITMDIYTHIGTDQIFHAKDKIDKFTSPENEQITTDIN